MHLGIKAGALHRRCRLTRTSALPRCCRQTTALRWLAAYRGLDTCIKTPSAKTLDGVI